MKSYNQNNIDEDKFAILRKIDNGSNTSQRKLAKELGFSLGKLNYCIKQLKKKGLIKIKNFRKNPKKINYLYVLTPQGISSKTRLTINFMRKKIKEYDELRAEIDSKNSGINNSQIKKIDDIENR